MIDCTELTAKRQRVMNYITFRLTKMKKRRKMKIKIHLSGIFFMSSCVKLESQKQELTVGYLVFTLFSRAIILYT